MSCHVACDVQNAIDLNVLIPVCRAAAAVEQLTRLIRQ